MEFVDLKAAEEFSPKHHVHKSLTAMTRMVLHRVQAGGDRRPESLDAWPTSR